jgi:hypothetical protein
VISDQKLSVFTCEYHNTSRDHYNADPLPECWPFAKKGEGKYTGTVTMELVPSQSLNNYGAYKFKLEVPNYGTYLGQAAAHGNNVAMHFALTDQSTKDYGTGIANFKKNKVGKWSFSKFYYEPEFKGGNYGTEECTLR